MNIKSILTTLIFITSAYFASASLIRADEPTTLEKIQALPFEPSGALHPFENFTAYGGAWTQTADGGVRGAADSGSRLTYNDLAWQTATKGTIELDLLFPKRQSGFSGLCFKISKSGIGADAFNGYEIGFDPNSGQINLGAHRHNYVQLKRIPCNIPVGEYFTLRVDFDSTSFKISIDGKQTGEIHEENPKENDPLQAGTFALRLWENDVEYRNLKVRLDENADGTINGQAKDVSFQPTEPLTGGYPETLSLDDLPPFIYLARHMLNRPNSVGNDFWQSTPQAQGCAIRLVDPSDPKKPIETIFEDPDGSIYDMNLSYDAKTIYFSYRPQESQYWNIWKIGVDGEGLTQLTSGPFFDVSPAELPDGDIIFVSSRRFGRTVCQPGPASNLFRMNANGGDIKCVSMNTLSDFDPHVLPDGRVIFTRWEYVDRDLTYRQSLWTQNPEGTLYQLYYGNTIRDFGSVLQARPIPGQPSSKALATFAPHHGYPHGAIGVVDRSAGIEAGQGKGFVFWTKDCDVVEDISREYAYRDPFPLDEDRAFCSYGSGGGTLGPNSTGSDVRYRIWLLDSSGKKRLLMEEPEFNCFHPIALEETQRPPKPATRINDPFLKVQLRPQLKQREIFTGLRQTDGVEACESYNQLAQKYNSSPEVDSLTFDGQDVPVGDWGIPERQDLLAGDPVGQVVLADVYQGLEPTVKRGEVKSIRIMEQIRKTEELYSRAFDQSPSMGVATYYAKRCWGVIPVEEDGSANFYVPALREIYFQALDSEGREIQRMTSAAQFMPGESVGCVGCHEDRDSIPATAQDASRRPIASTRAPNIPVLPDYIYAAYEERQKEGGNLSLDAGVVDYPSLVQPVLDQYCISCHDGVDPAGGYDLSGDATRYFSESYENLLLKSRSYRQGDMLTGELLDSQKKLEKPLVQFYWLLYTTSAVNVPYTTGALASRLPDYFTAEHCGRVVDRLSMSRINFWLDSNAIYQGTYAHARPQSSGRRDRWAPLDGEGQAEWFNNELKPVYDNKCAECHQNLLGGDHDLEDVYDSIDTDWIGRFSWINLTHPEESPLLTAHLPKDKGGRGLSIDTNGNTNDPKFIFESKDDPDWQAMYNAILKGKADADSRPEADRKGFASARPEP